MIKKNQKQNVETVETKPATSSKDLLLARKAELAKEKQLNPLYANQEIIQAEIKTAISPIIDALVAIDKKIINVNDKSEKIYSHIFNDNAEKNYAALIQRITDIEKTLTVLLSTVAGLNTVKTIPATVVPATVVPATVVPATVVPATGKAIDIISGFKKYFSGNIDDNAFRKFYAGCNFSTVATMEESFKKWNAENEKLLCARKSNQSFKQALWQLHEDNKGNKPATTTPSAPISSPAKTIKSFADALNTDESELQCFIDVMKLQGFINSDSDKDLLVSIAETNGIECHENDIDGFLLFVSESLKIKIK